MSTIGFIGSGNIGSTLARLAVDAGFDVVLSNSRGPETLSDLVAELGDHARAGTRQQAAAADLVVVTVPLGRVEEIPSDLLAGKIVVDTCNYYPQRDGGIAALDEKRTTTSGLVQERFPDAHVVKAFNNIHFTHLGSMQRPAGAADRNTLMIAGDDADAKRAVARFIEAIGYDVFDTGSLADSWRQQRDQPAYAGAYAEGGDFAKPKRADRAELQALLDKADPAIR
jgi:8-hydroxy-5-deazaflavin:NADPH oxidoreductase